MSGISLSVNIRGENDLLAGLMEKLRDLSPVTKDMGERMRFSVEENFRTGGRPMPWIPSKKATGRTLIDTARLKNSITYRAGKDSVAVGTNVVYGKIHQLGGKAGRGKKVNIPARPFLVVQDSDLHYLRKSLQEFLSP